MQRRDWRLLAFIVVLIIVAAWMDWPSTQGFNLDLGPIHIHRVIKLQQGLDLRGGLEMLLVADVPAGQTVSADSMAAAKVIVENRVNGLGVTEPLVQLQGQNAIVVELPGISDPEQAISLLKTTGSLEFVDAGTTVIPQGALIHTTGTAKQQASSGSAEQYFKPDKVFETKFSGADLANAAPGRSQTGAYEVNIEFKPEAATRFATYTSQNVGKILAIVLDGRVLSSPRIENAIPEGRASITGNFTLEEARSLALQLKYGALPVPLKVEESRNVGPTLGQDSVRKSVTAGIVGLSMILLFMLVYYRVPGLLASIALVTYALINLALYKFIPVTMTLPGITGFLLSTGMAVDANILIFERMKEELRWGRGVEAAIDAGFHRAWTSIRDSNLSTLITCVILYWFGSSFGASQVRGFAITLFLGVLISMFTAIVVTRTLVRLVFHYWGQWLRARRWALGMNVGG